MDIAIFFADVARKRDTLLAIVLTPRDHEALKEHVKKFTYLQGAWRNGDSFMGVPVVKRRFSDGASWLVLDDRDGIVVQVLS